MCKQEGRNTSDRSLTGRSGELTGRAASGSNISTIRQRGRNGIAILIGTRRNLGVDYLEKQIASIESVIRTRDGRWVKLTLKISIEEL